MRARSAHRQFLMRKFRLPRIRPFETLARYHLTCAPRPDGLGKQPTTRTVLHAHL